MLAVAACFPAALLPAQEETLRTALDVRSLPAERAVAELPAELDGVVGFIDPPTAFFQDATGATFFRAPDQELRALRIGDRVRVSGTTFPGLYLPGVQASRVTVAGHGPAPHPVPATPEDLASGRLHYQLVTLEGVGRSRTVREEDRAVLRLATGGRIVEIRSEGSYPESDWVDARVRVTGLAAGSINDRRQLVEPYLRLAAPEDVVVLRPPPAPDAVPGIPLSGLMRFRPGEASGEHRVRIRGTVLASFPGGEIYLRGEPEPESGTAVAVAVRAEGAESLRPGQTAEVAGFPVMGRFSASLDDAEIWETGPTVAGEQAEEVTVEELFTGRLDADLVQTVAVLGDAFRTPQGMELFLRAGPGRLRAVLPDPPAEPLVAGSRLRLTGICRVETSVGEGYRSVPDQVVLRVRGPQDVRVLEVPSWWTVPRLLTVVGLLAAAVAWSGTWIVALRRRVAVQADALRRRIAREAVLEERERIAREFHDTLEQELAGLTLRLDAADACGLDDRAKPLVAGSRQLVRRIQAEARMIVTDLREHPRGIIDLPTALRDLVDRCQVPGGPEIRLELGVAGEPRFPADVAHHLHMIAREAVGNALKHAAARRIVVGWRREGEAWVLEVRDDGGGMETSAARGRPGHFGCQGIRERATRIGADVEWTDAPGGGTVFRVTKPWPEPAT